MQEQNLRQICLQKICAQQNNSKLHQCNSITMKNISLEITPIRRFTFHYVSINSIRRLHLQQVSSQFTSHYVSINLEFRANPSEYQVNLHPTMYLLIHDSQVITSASFTNLHPTMYLLIPQHSRLPFSQVRKFTSHYVSINSSKNLLNCSLQLIYLHPTMYLLIPNRSRKY